MDLFTQLEEVNKQTPLAEILRPKTLDEFLGQSNVVAPNSPLLNLLKTQRLFSLILWGTPGCGKTTLARLIATKVNAQFIELSAVTSGIKEIKETVEQARQALRSGQKTILFIDILKHSRMLCFRMLRMALFSLLVLLPRIRLFRLYLLFYQEFR